MILAEGFTVTQHGSKECGATATQVSVLCGSGRHSHAPLPPRASILKWVCLRYLVCM